jgi:hypothetical protein
MNDQDLYDLSLAITPSIDGEPSLHLRVVTIVTVSPLTVLLDTTIVPAVILSGTAPPVGAVAVALTRLNDTPLLLGTPSQAPWGAAWGEVAYAERTSNQTGITVITDLTDLSITWTAVAGRKYLVTGHVLALQNTAAGIPEVRITTGGNAEAGSIAAFTVAAGEFATLTPRARLTGLAAGSVTYKLRATTTAGTFTSQASATRVASILAQDIGPV